MTEADAHEINHEAERFGRRLRALRKARGWSQTQLADKVKAQAKDISMYETGQRLPQRRRQYRLATVLECDRGWLIGFEGAHAPTWIGETDL